jgi:hypothetical protein
VQEAGYGRIGPRTKAQLEKDYLQAIDDKIYQEILVVVKEEIKKTLLQQSEEKKPIVQETASTSTGKQNQDNSVTTGQIQKIIESETPKSDKNVLNSQTLSIFI